MARLQRVFIDTSELFPFTIMDVLLTRNLKHFRAAAIDQAGVRVMTSDSYLSRLLARRRRAVVESFTRAAGTKKNPPMGPHELADRVASAGAPRFAERLRPHLGR